MTSASPFLIAPVTRCAVLAWMLRWRPPPCFLGHPVTAAQAARSLAVLLKPDPLTLN